MNDPSPFARMEARDRLSRLLFDGLLRLLRPSVVCDVGAFNGDETIRFARVLPAARVVAFEASEDNIRSFWTAHPRWNGLPQVTIEHLAVAGHSGTVGFNILDVDEDSPAWRRGANSILDRVEEIPSRRVTVPSTSLDDYFDGGDEETFALWIDVEGALSQVLAGATEVLDRTLFLRAEVERKAFWEGHVPAHDIKADLARRGFACLGDTHSPDAYDQSDVLYIRTDVMDLLGTHLTEDKR